MDDYAFEIRDEENNLILPIDLFKGLIYDKYNIIEINQHRLYSDKVLVSVKVSENKNDYSYNKSLIDKRELEDNLKTIQGRYTQYSLSFSEAVIIDKIFSDIYKVIK